MAERWAPITDAPGFEDFYSISDRGRCLAHRRLIMRVRGEPYWREPQIIAPRVGNKLGHLCVTLYDADGRRHKKWIHRLVAIEFIPNPHGFPYVLHGFDGPAVNRVENLRWGTQSDNERDKMAHRLERQRRREEQL